VSSWSAAKDPIQNTRSNQKVGDSAVAATHHTVRRRFRPRTTFGNVGVTGMIFGGLLGGCLAA
jgi:hypothetical protein